MKKTLCVLAAVLCSGYAAASTAVIYPRDETPNDPRNEYPVKVLELALKKSGGDYQAKASQGVMQQGRAILEIEKAAPEPTVMWTMTSKERETSLLPIRIPIEKGLIGWRLPLVMQAKAEQFKDVKSLDDMKKFSAGQGHDWPDTEILRNNGLTVQGASSYAGLFPMLTGGRFDYFPRSISEIWGEADGHKAENIVVDSHVILHYPAAIYFFVSKKNTKLANDLKTGLDKAIADGSFDALFHQYNDTYIKRAKLENRAVIELKNPLLPAETPLDKTEYWLKFSSK